MKYRCIYATHPHRRLRLHSSKRWCSASHSASPFPPAGPLYIYIYIYIIYISTYTYTYIYMHIYLFLSILTAGRDCTRIDDGVRLHISLRHFRQEAHRSRPVGALLASVDRGAVRDGCRREPPRSHVGEQCKCATGRRTRGVRGVGFGFGFGFGLGLGLGWGNLTP